MGARPACERRRFNLDNGSLFDKNIGSYNFGYAPSNEAVIQPLMGGQAMSRALKYYLPAIILCFVSGTALCTESIYTWTDKDGVIHMTNKQPPKGVTIEDRVDYQPLPPDSEPAGQGRSQTGQDTPDLKRTLDELARERQKATAADAMRMQRSKQPNVRYRKQRNTMKRSRIKPSNVKACV